MQLKDFDFRLWHKPSKSFVEIRGSFLTANAKDEIVFEKSLIVPIDDENIEIELWSGLCDKKGERIYEGDIVKNRNLDTLLCLFDKHNLRFVFKYINRKEYDICYTAMDILEVLGNIHENADLLEEEKVFIKKCKYADIECLCGK